MINFCRTCSSGRLLLKNGGNSKQVKGDELMVKVQRLSNELDKYNLSEHQGRMNEGRKSTLSKTQPS